MPLLQYLRIWLASARYAIVRTLMFRGDFLVWATVELAWTVITVLFIEMIYRHTQTIAGWSKYEMLLLTGTAMVIQRLFTGFFWSNLFELGGHIRTGYFDFFLSQPGNPLFMVSTRKLDPDGLVNSLVGMAVVIYSAHRLGLHPGAGDIALYVLMLFCGLAIHYSVMVLIASLGFWIVNARGIEGTYFTLFEFSRLPREAFSGIMRLIFVFGLPAVVVTNVPANSLLHGFQPRYALWLLGISLAWLAFAVFVFRLGLRRYSSASS